MRNKVLASLVVLAMALTPVIGCCTRVDSTTKVTTKSFSNCLATAQQILCDPTDAQKAEAAAVVAFLTSGIQVASIVVTVPITAVEVTTIFSVVRVGGCVLTTDMQLALSWYAALTSTLQTQTKVAGVKKALQIPPVINALYVWK